MGIPLILGSSLGTGGGGVPGGEDNPTLIITDGTTTVDFINGVLRLRYQGWEMQGPTPESETTLQGYGASYKFTGYQPITETFELIAMQQANNLVIRQSIAALDKLLEQARRWHTNRGAYTNAVYLANNATTEASRQSLVYGGSITMNSGSGAQPTLTNNNALATLTIIRHPLWMDAAPVVQMNDIELSTNGGYSAVLAQTGSAPALIRDLKLLTASTTALTKYWIGILDSAGIDRSDFRPQFPLSSGTLWDGSGGTTDYGADLSDPDEDPDGIGSQIVEVDFDNPAHADMHPRVTISIFQIDAAGAHWEQWRGVFRVLCRCRVGAGTTVGLQLKWGNPNNLTSPNLGQASEVVITNTTYKWIDLGECSIPAEPQIPNNLGYYNDHAFHIYAERLAGANNLALDYLVLMPAEHLATLENAGTAAIGAIARTTHINTDVNDTLMAYEMDSVSQISGIPTLAARDFYFPCYTGGVVVVVAERSAAAVKTDTVIVDLSTYARWQHYRDS